MEGVKVEGSDGRKRSKEATEGSDDGGKRRKEVIEGSH
jgi:hypothetical protein